MARVAGTSLLGLNAWERHKRFISDMVAYYGEKLPEVQHSLKSDQEVLRQNYRFIRSREDDAEGGWELQLAQIYYSKLFKEYAVADLSRYKEGKVGLRWRTEKEVVDGKGQFICGAKQCDERRGLASFEVPFSYKEAGQAKQALVKVRVCPKHAQRLNYRKLKEQRKAERRAAKKRKSRRHPSADEGGEDENGAERRDEEEGHGAPDPMRRHDRFEEADPGRTEGRHHGEEGPHRERRDGEGDHGRTEHRHHRGGGLQRERGDGEGDRGRTAGWHRRGDGPRRGTGYEEGGRSERDQCREGGYPVRGDRDRRSDAEQGSSAKRRRKEMAGAGKGREGGVTGSGSLAAKGGFLRTQASRQGESKDKEARLNAEVDKFFAGMFL